MDEIVRLAMAKWPNVPHCHGWLRLDARGAWRMRDERAQALGLPGERIAHPALLGFINRNYTRDQSGCWYFQNGPQRVYVDLEATPHIVRTDPAQGLVLHTGAPMPAPVAAWLTRSGSLLLQGPELVAQLDDRDLGEALAGLRLDGRELTDDGLERLLADDAPAQPGLALAIQGKALPLTSIDDAGIAERFGFVQKPRPEQDH